MVAGRLIVGAPSHFMKTILIILLSITCALTLRAQTNIAFTGIKIIPDPMKTNFNRITLDVTNIHPNQTYAMLFTKRLVTGGFAFYITFASPSNSITIVRQTTNAIPIRFYRVASTNIFAPSYTGGFYVDGPSEWDEHDMVCEECEQEEQAQRDTESFQSTMRYFGLEPRVPDDILEIIMPPGLKPSQR